MRYYDINTNEHEAVTGSNGSVNTNITGSDASQGFDHQATLVNTAVTHSGAVIVNGTSNVQATWQPVPDGMSEFLNNLTADAGLTTITVNVQWSEDGTAISGKTANSVPSNTNGQKTSNNWLAVGGSFYKVEVFNGDASPHTCGANIKFRP